MNVLSLPRREQVKTLLIQILRLQYLPWIQDNLDAMIEQYPVFVGLPYRALPHTALQRTVRRVSVRLLFCLNLYNNNHDQVYAVIQSSRQGEASKVV